MARVLRFESTDQRITYTPNWTIMPNSGVGQNGTYSLASTINAGFFFLFRGTHLAVYPLLLLILMVSDTVIPSQVQASDFMAV